MKPEDPHHEIGELLRLQKPAPEPSPTLEARILESLPARTPESRARWSPWWLLPPAVAAGWALFSTGPTPPASPPVAGVPIHRRDVTPPSVAPALDDWNPLHAETKALGHDAEKAGRFLIDCLPSFDLAGN